MNEYDFDQLVMGFRVSDDALKAFLGSVEAWRNKTQAGIEAGSKNLMSIGWIIFPDDWPVNDVAAIGQLHPRELPDLDARIEEWARDSVSRFESQIIQWFPKRSAPVTAAFECHRQGHYWCSIPTMFAQADGMAHDAFDTEVFNKRREKDEPKIAEPLREFVGTDTVLWALALGFTLMNDLNKNSKQASGLNRHAVLHGVDITYGLEENNALRAATCVHAVAAIMFHCMRIGR